ncbi:MAG: S24/S26 family peptidase [Oscillospiraceae bacterium]|nr:S24/S26 family peptidase [Oscillospiraceae bacterium]
MNSTIEETLDRFGRIIQTTVGDSMQPMLKNRKNAVVIEKPDRCLKKYDIALYRRPDGKYVLHRIIKVCKNEYITCGDNRWTKERVPHSWIIGVTTGFYSKGRFITVNDLRYRAYVILWCTFFPVRAFVLWFINSCRRVWNKCLRR